ncbi:MAG: hypothetical protein SVM80_07380 [Halobacteriota archaeon]|nr:hypothetical protein [Halobacteriota archaeon]
MDFGAFHKEISKGEMYPEYIRVPTLILSNWVFQCILYMDRTERAFKILLDLILAVILYFGFTPYSAPIPALILSISSAHTINWVFNGQIFVLLKNLRLTEIEQEYFISYADGLQRRINGKKSILFAAIFGSLSRDELRKSSDLDVRIIRRQGVVNGFRSCLFALMERSQAFLLRFPLDIYVLDDLQSLSKLREDEVPVVLYDPEKLVGEYEQWR